MSHLEKLKNKMAEKASSIPITHTIYPIVTTNVDIFNINFEIDPEQIVNSIRNFRATHEDSNTSNVKAWHSPWHLNDYSKDFDKLIKIVEDKVLQCLSSPNVRKIECVENWAIMYKKGDKTIRHKHSDQHYSAVYYAKAEKNAAALKFDNLNITPKTGMLVCFPGWLWHQVTEITEDQERICMSFNLNCIMVKGEK